MQRSNRRVFLVSAATAASLPLAAGCGSDAVDEAVVDFGSGIVRVQGGRLRRDLLAAAITRAGFTVDNEPAKPQAG